jgi:hypothetical protein
MTITSKNINNKIIVIIDGIEIGHIHQTQGENVIVYGNDIIWKIKYSYFV